jgi:hypothetical protein
MIDKYIYFGGDLSYKRLIIDSIGNERLIETDSIKKADIVYWVYGTGPRLKAHFRVWISRSKKIIIHWIGTDVLIWDNKLTKYSNMRSYLHYRLWRWMINYKQRIGTLHNYAGSTWLKSELSEIGISSEVLPITSVSGELVNSYKRRSSRKYDYVSYIPLSRFSFYNGDLIMQIARIMREYNFVIIHPDITSIEDINESYPANVKVYPKIGFKMMQQLLANTKCFLRFTEHDGLSLSVLEALLSEQKVFWTYNFPHTQKVELKNTTIDELVQTLSHAVKEWTPNELGRDNIVSNYTISAMAERYKDVLP